MGTAGCLREDAYRRQLWRLGPGPDVHRGSRHLSGHRACLQAARYRICRTAINDISVVDKGAAFNINTILAQHNYAEEQYNMNICW